MKILQRLTFRNEIRNVVIAVLYFIFALYGVYMIFTTDDLAGKVCYAILCTLVLSIALWAEYLRSIYYKAIKLLNMNCEPEAAKALFNKLLKKDFFRAYRKTELVFDTLYTLDCMNPQACLNVIKKDEKFFCSSLDNLLIKNYSLFYSNFLLNNRSKAETLYKDVIKLKGVKIKGSKISPLYNWDFVDAIYYLASRDYKKSRQAFARCNIINFNQRELAHFYYQYARLEEETKNMEKRNVYYDKLAAMRGSHAFMSEARKIRGNAYENE